MLESHYQAYLIKKIRRELFNCMILKNDANLTPGIPDLLILFNDRWAMLEVKSFAESPFQPNQEYFLKELDKMSFASVIYPEIEEEVLDALHTALKPRRSPRVSKRQQVSLG